MEMKIGVIKGDGIGPEIVDEAMKVLDQTAKVYGHSISYTQLLMRRLLHGISSNHQNVRKRVCYSLERDLIFLQT